MDFRPTNKAKGVYNVKGGGGEGKEESTKGNVMGWVGKKIGWKM